MLQSVAIYPHPPIIIPEIGGDNLSKVDQTIEAVKILSQNIKVAHPDLIIFITPHGPVFQDAITISHPSILKGSLKKFGFPQEFVKETDQNFSDLLIKNSHEIKAMVYQLKDIDATNYEIDLELDHGILVPLYFLDKAGLDTPIVPINMGLLPFNELYEFGICLQKTIKQYHKRVVVIVSADLSHRLTKDAPAGFDPQGKVFDEIMVQAIAEGDVLRIINIDHQLIERSGECGLRPIIMGLGIFEGHSIESTVYSYEGPFGVGYLVGELKPAQECPSRNLLTKIYAEKLSKITGIRANESWPVRWARENLELHLNTNTYPPDPHIPEEFKVSAGVFVSLKKDGQLRGCIGTIAPTTHNISQEIQRNVKSAALNDPRFEPVEIYELDEIIFTVDILEKPEKIQSINDLDPANFGVIVTKGPKQGLLLPMLDGIDTPQQQVAIAKEKAGIKPHEEVDMERFRVTRYT